MGLRVGSEWVQTSGNASRNLPMILLFKTRVFCFVGKSGDGCLQNDILFQVEKFTACITVI